MIQEMKQGFAFEQTGRFKLGDILLIVNDNVLDGMTPTDAMRLLRECPSHFKVVAKRFAPSLGDQGL